MPITAGNIEIHLGPKEQGGPDDLLQAILGFIRKAKKNQNLMIAIQEIDNQEIAKEIIRARLREVNIDLVIEQSYLLPRQKPNSVREAFKATGVNEKNRTLMNAILRSTTDVKLDFNPNIFHQKFMILGNSVLTGSTNFTTTGVTKNLNHVVIIKDAQVSNAFKKEFSEIKNGRFGRQSIDRDETPKEARVSGMRVKPLFAPDHGPEMEIMKQILKAQTRIDFAVFTFAKSSGIDDALISAHRRGVSVTGLLDKKQANQKWAAKSSLKEAGIRIKQIGGQGKLGKLHHKVMVIDDNVSIFGSFNYTMPANKANDENIVVIGDRFEKDQRAKTLQQKIARATREEIIRIATTFG